MTVAKDRAGLGPNWVRGGASLSLLMLASTGACNTGAVAVGECREIERARCDALAHCGIVEDVTACKRFVRDSCLHGVAGPKAPTASEQKACVTMITEAGRCAEEDPKMLPRDCEGLDEADISPIEGAKSARNVCELAQKPWNYVTCDYVNEVEESMGGGKS
ncbi:MAG: hypothetical protein B6A08_13235 [Sorangiineae bacterium NIC37A_2]|jgi:hypothetical protein|nr:MAG: hypothetical protein B6A08_13235 [Sorangiineae bacterium NIC37A_2]